MPEGFSPASLKWQQRKAFLGFYLQRKTARKLLSSLRSKEAAFYFARRAWHWMGGLMKRKTLSIKSLPRVLLLNPPASSPVLRDYYCSTRPKARLLLAARGPVVPGRPTDRPR